MENDNYSSLLKFFVNEFDVNLLLDKRKPNDEREEALLKIFNRLNDIQTIIVRLNRYNLYFNNFYPADRDLIDEAEALEYHLHSYLQDFYSLREKFKKLIRCIENNLKYFEIANPEDIKKMLDHLLRQIRKGFKRVSNLRGDHVHDMSVRDSEISKARLLLTLSNLEDVDIEETQLKYNEIIARTKKKYVDQAETNREQLNRVKNFMASRLGYIIAFLYEKDISSFEMQISQIK